MRWLFGSKPKAGYVGKRRASGESTAQKVKGTQMKRGGKIAGTKPAKPNGATRWWQ